MEKKSVKKVSTKKKAMTKGELEEILLNNFVNLQKVLTNLSIKFEELSGNMSKLLQLFEISAKSFTEKYSGGGVGDKDMLNKLDSLLDQNKTIAKGIMLMEERIKQKNVQKSPQVNQKYPKQEYPKQEYPKQGYPKFQGMMRSMPSQ